MGITVGGCMMGLKTSGSNSGTAGATDTVPRVIQARRFDVIGSGGDPIVTIGPNKDGTGGVVFVNNDEGNLVVQIGTADDGRGVVWTYDSAGQWRYGIR